MERYIKTFEQFNNEDLNEAKSKWTLGSDGGPRMARFSGKTWPSIEYEPKSKKIYARDNNGPHPSETLSTDDLTVKGMEKLLNGISRPWPTYGELEEFISRIK